MYKNKGGYFLLELFPELLTIIFIIVSHKDDKRRHGWWCWCWCVTDKVWGSSKWPPTQHRWCMKATRHSSAVHRLTVDLLSSGTSSSMDQHFTSIEVTTVAVFWHCLHSMRSRGYEKVRCLFISPLVSPSMGPQQQVHSSKAATAGLLLWARLAGDIDRLVHRGRRMRAVLRCQHT